MRTSRASNDGRELGFLLLAVAALMLGPGALAGGVGLAALMRCRSRLWLLACAVPSCCRVLAVAVHTGAARVGACSGTCWHC
jgi:hypothetical protein